ncbi:hypothetical protein EDB19DRAFT_980918 [Suillus lakei]|nr:hypothetical protein EDB19DRAFT_980918 [Suillus lakei]
MSIIEKLQETSGSGSITTLFRLGSVAAISSLSKQPPFHSPVTGFSWCLTINKSSKKCQLAFNSRSCPDAWRGTPVKVTVSFPSNPGDSSLRTRSIAALLGVCDLNSKHDYLLIACSVEKLKDALVLLEITFTNPLACNLFDVLVPVGPIPDAPASAEEPRVPLACSALRALEQSLKTGTSFDLKFQAYSRRLSCGKVTGPIPVYASTAVLQATLPDFSGGDLDFPSLFELSEGDTLPPTSLENYEYESDSDLDDDDGRKDNNPTPVGNESHGDTTDSGSISSFSSIEAGPQEQPDNRPLPLEDVGMVPIVIDENLKRGSRVVLVKGVAWKTWHAFIYYCYTGIVNFANLRSQSMVDAALQQSRLEDGPPHCSPKSMYQLARKLNNEPLSQLALKAIETRLSAANILDEAFSKFTSRHDTVRAMETALLLKHRNASEVVQGLPTKMEAVARGNIPNAGQVLTALIMQIPGQN